MGRKRNTVVRVVEPVEEVEETREDATPAETPEECPDLDMAAIEAAIESRDLKRLADVLTDVERVKGELETELADAKANLGKRIKTVRARLSDLIHEIEEATHEWVTVPEEGLAYLKSKIDGRVKRTRPLAQEEYTAELPFARES